MAGPKPQTLTLQEIARAFRVQVQTIREWRAQGMPHRMVGGRPLFDLPACIEWRREKDRESARDEAAPDEAKERARKMRAEAELKELEVARIRGQQVPVEQYEERAEAFVGGFAAVAAGQLHRFERDIVKASTAAEARRLTQQMHAALMHGAQEYADTLEAEVQATEPGEEAA